MPSFTNASFLLPLLFVWVPSSFFCMVLVLEEGTLSTREWCHPGLCRTCCSACDPPLFDNFLPLSFHSSCPAFFCHFLLLLFSPFTLLLFVGLTSPSVWVVLSYFFLVVSGCLLASSSFSSSFSCLLFYLCFSVFPIFTSSLHSFVPFHCFIS